MESLQRESSIETLHSPSRAIQKNDSIKIKSKLHGTIPIQISFETKKPEPNNLCALNDFNFESLDYQYNHKIPVKKSNMAHYPYLKKYRVKQHENVRSLSVLERHG